MEWVIICLDAERDIRRYFYSVRYLLRQLHKSFADKAEVRPRAGIASCAEDDDGMTIVMEAGEVIRDHMLAGADGVHSAVRRLIYG